MVSQFSEISRSNQTANDSTTATYSRIAQEMNSAANKIESSYQANPSANLGHILPNLSLVDTPDCHTTGPDRTYVGQAKSELHQALTDVKGNKVGQGEDDINKAMTDLSKEHKMIAGAQAGGNEAEKLLKTHIIEPLPLNGGKGLEAGTAGSALPGQPFINAAEQQLTKTIDGLKGSGFNAAARTDYENALSALKHGLTGNAINNINLAEQYLSSRDQQVHEATTDLNQGLIALKSGNNTNGVTDVQSALDTLNQNPKQLPPPPLPPWGPIPVPPQPPISKPLPA